ncbi:VOC family protein [Mycobacterium sp. URHB0021]
MAFVTNNMDETVKFYNGLLGFPVVVTLQLPNPDPFPGAVPGNLGGSRHYFFRISEQDTIAFFEFLDVETPADNSLLGAGNHLAITVPSETELQNAKTLLEANGVKIKSDLDHGFCHSIYFEDPVNKIALEFATWKHACDAEEPFLQDPNPVPAALEAIGQDKYSRFQLHYSPDGHGGAEPRN